MKIRDIEQQREFGKKLKEIRKSKGITQAELGHKIGVSPAAISRWENGVHSITHEAYRRILLALGLEL